MKYIIEFIRLLKGYVVVEITGGFPERFMNLCNREKIYLWDIVYEDNVIRANVGRKCFFRLKKIRKKSGVRIKIINKRGLVFFLRKTEKRRVAVFAIISALLFMLFMNQFVWVIDVSGNENISCSEILNAVKELGLDYGSFVPSFDENAVSRTAVNQFDGKLLWLAINIKGSKASIEVRERNILPANSIDTKPCNIVADFDGVIVSSDVYSGVSVVSSGASVKNGDLLVSGIYENSDATVKFLSADAKLTALHKKSVDIICNNLISAAKINDYSEYLSVKLFFFDIPFTGIIKNEKEYFSEYYRLAEVDGNELPLGVGFKCNYNLNSTVELYENYIYHIDEFTAKEYKDFKNTLIIDAVYCFSKNKNGYNIKADYNCIDFIGKKSVILREN